MPLDLRSKTRTEKIAVSALLAAIAVSLSGFSIPVGPSRCFPIQHAVNVVAGVILGPWWALGAAVAASAARNLLGTGTILAFPGSAFGALAAGFAANALPAGRRDFAALCEPLATGTAGAWVGTLLLASASAQSASYSFLATAFITSSIPGAGIGFALLRSLGCFKLRARERKGESGRD